METMDKLILIAQIIFCVAALICGAMLQGLIF